MSAEPHEGVLIFDTQVLGRTVVLLGVVQVGEIVKSNGDKCGAYFRIYLPDIGPSAWRGASDVDAAKQHVIRLVGHWLEATSLQPMGAR